MISFIFDLFLVSLLFIAIVFCFKLNARLKSMRQMGEELSPFMKNVAGYIGQISQTIDRLKAISDTSNQGLNDQIPLAVNLKDDLDILLEYSDKMAKRLDEVIDKARSIDVKLQETLRLAEVAVVTQRSIDTVRRVREPVAPTPEPIVENKVVTPPQATHFNEYAPDFFSMPELDLNNDEKEFFLSNLLSRTDFEQRKGNENVVRHQPKAVQQKGGIMAKLRGLR